MSFEEYVAALGMVASRAHCTSPEGTVLHYAWNSISAMTTAYLNDGKIFYAKGDLVNALAAFSYAAGWLGAGYELGLIVSSTPLPSLHLGHLPEVDVSDRLLEKRTRYHHMLEQGIRSLEIAPDRQSTLYQGAEVLLTAARSALSHGERFSARACPLQALWCYSFGHGWLDAGVRTGLFRIIGDRTLFTI